MKRWLILLLAGPCLGNTGCLVNVYSPDPDKRIKELINSSEDLRAIQKDWEQSWFADHPFHLTPERIHGGIQDLPAGNEPAAPGGPLASATPAPAAGNLGKVDPSLLDSSPRPEAGQKRNPRALLGSTKESVGALLARTSAGMADSIRRFREQHASTRKARERHKGTPKSKKESPALKTESFVVPPDDPRYAKPPSYPRESLLSRLAPYSMGIFTPLPIPPWVTERMEEKYCPNNNFRTPILPPIREGYPPPLCEDPPDDASVLRAMPKVARGIPYFCEESRADVQVHTELLVDKIDPPRFFPLVGPAQLHHCHWKCTIYYTETIESAYPFPFRCKKPRVQVVYIDKDHLHLYPGATPEREPNLSAACPAADQKPSRQRAHDNPPDAQALWTALARLAGSLVPAKTWVQGMTLPSGSYLQHPQQYFPPSSGFPLSRELAMQEKTTASPTPALPPDGLPQPPSPALLPEDRPRDAGRDRPLVVPVGGTVLLRMKSGKPIRMVINPKDNVLGIRTLANDPTAILLTGQAADVVTVVLTDIDDHQETKEVNVGPDTGR